jgi:hypothetical protein
MGMSARTLPAPRYVPAFVRLLTLDELYAIVRLDPDTTCRTGCEAAISGPLFVLSTFETDYLLVRERDLHRSVEALTRAGHAVDG